MFYDEGSEAPADGGSAEKTEEQASPASTEEQSA